MCVGRLYVHAEEKPTLAPTFFGDASDKTVYFNITIGAREFNEPDQNTIIYDIYITITYINA